jgi:hypothetical protein
MNACNGKDIPLDIIKQGLSDSDCDVRTAAMNACNGKDIPLDIIKQGLSDSDWKVRTAAMNACNGKDIPLDIIKQGLSDSDCDVRTAAMKYIKDNNIENIYIPYRSIEPLKEVYKKCMGDVIVVATIPDDAEVRGSYNSKCRTNKAKIIDIIGAFGGVKVGVSMYDMTTTYFIGDDVYIDDFDLSNSECSTGFHFFCDIEQAKNYNF